MYLGLIGDPNRGSIEGFEDGTETENDRTTDTYEFEIGTIGMIRVTIERIPNAVREKETVSDN